jgi:hypothetical protein
VTPLRFNEASKGIEPAPAAGRVILCWWRGIQGCGLGIDSKPAAPITDVKIKKPAGWRAFLFVKWMGWQDCLGLLPSPREQARGLPAVALK